MSKDNEQLLRVARVLAELAATGLSPEQQEHLQGGCGFTEEEIEQAIRDAYEYYIKHGGEL